MPEGHAGADTLLIETARPRIAPYLAPGASRGIVVAVSGGPDSMALLHVVAALAGSAEVRSADVPIRVATVDHGLRPEAAGEAAAVARRCDALGLSHAILPWRGDKPATGLQAAARAARYDLLLAHALEHGASHLLTAHTLDDQAETVLMRLLRGSGPSGLAAMAPETRRGGIVLARPFLAFRKHLLVAACEAGGWPYVIDPSNADPRFLRARLRRIAPILEAEGLGPEGLARLATRMGRVEVALDAMTEEAFAEARVGGSAQEVVLDMARLGARPDEIVLRVLARAVAQICPERDPPRLEVLERAVRRLLAPPAGPATRRISLNLGGAWIRLAAKGRLRVTREPDRRS